MALIPVISSVLFGILSLILLISNVRTKSSSKLFMNRFTELEQENSLLQNEKIEYIKEIERNKAELNANQKIIDEFDKIRQESQQSTKAALFDLGNELSKQLIDIHKKENQESREASEKNIKQTTEKFNNEFERIVSMVGSLSKEISQSRDTVELIKGSLLSPSGAGALAEITLENILKNSGLRKGLDFSLQHQTISSDSNKLRPDAVIFLPGDNLMVVDAKASKHLLNEANNDITTDALLARSMNLHLKSLAGKDYGEAVLNSVDRKKISMVITLMFLPSEHAIEKLVAADKDFLHKAWSNNIFPVGPAGLMNMLSFAKFQITEQLMFENHKMIIEEVKKLIASVATLTEHSSRLGSNIQSVVNNYDKFAASFNRNFLSRAKAVARLGIDSGVKKISEPLVRYQIVSSKTEMLDIEPDEPSATIASEEIKKLEA